MEPGCISLMVHGPFDQVMKIVFANDLIYAYATDAPSAIGGAERQQWLFARALAAAGWQVTVGVRQSLEYKRRVHIEGVGFVGIGESNSCWPGIVSLSRNGRTGATGAAQLTCSDLTIAAKFANVRSIFAVAFDRDVDIRHALYLRPRWWPLYALGVAWADKIFVQNDKQL